MLNDPTIYNPVDCNPDITEPPVVVEPPPAVTICPGWTIQLVANVVGATWSSSDEAVAVVDQNGLVEAIASGTATITATKGDVSSSVTVTIDSTDCPALAVTMNGGCTTCTGDSYTMTFEVTGGTGSYTLAIVAGTLPVGLSLSGMVISGTANDPGYYPIVLHAEDSNGVGIDFLAVISVLGITTTSLPAFTVGTPYSFQLEATGGSGNYGWTIPTGTLPAGLSMSTGGLISGTPSAGGNVDLTFHVVDLNCGPFVPEGNARVSFTTASTTTIKTKHGWPEYVPSTGALYKRMDWTGYQKVLCLTAADIPHSLSPTFCAGARFDYSGYSAIDTLGNFTHQHVKELRAACDHEPYPRISSNSPTLAAHTVIGYCWAPDPASCSSCSDDEGTWLDMGNRATYSQYDFPGDMYMYGPLASITPTTFSYNSPGFIGGLVLIGDPVTNFPETHYNGIAGPWLSYGSSGIWTATLSDEYTDADAEATKVVTTSTGYLAENYPSYQQWQSSYLTHRQSRVTDVDYTLHLYDMIVGRDYEVTVIFVDDAFVTTSVVHPHTAAASTGTITAAIPAPASGHTRRIKSVTIQFAV